VNIDIHPDADLRLDLRRRWPFRSGSAEIVFGEHVFEHLRWPVETRHFLAEAHRVLAPGGVLRLSVPDAARHVMAYVTRDAAFATQFGPFLPPGASTACDALNHHFRQFGEHHFAYDAETLADRLVAAGFRDPAVVASSDEFEQAQRSFESLVMQAVRP
jgi:predicted SAM-dependent methyltransferase